MEKGNGTTLSWLEELRFQRDMKGVLLGRLSETTLFTSANSKQSIWASCTLLSSLKITASKSLYAALHSIQFATIFVRSLSSTP